MQEFDIIRQKVYDISVLEPFVRSLPNDGEQRHTMILLLNLVNLNDYMNDYSASVSLHKYAVGMMDSILSEEHAQQTQCRELHLLKLWTQMAGREADMTIFHFGEALRNVRSSMKNAPTLSANTNHRALRDAAKQLSRDFRNYELARHAAGHRAEAIASVERLKKHAKASDHGKQFLSGSVVGNEYIATFEGAELKVVLTTQACQKLSDITKLAYSAFPKLVDKLPQL